MNSYPDCLSCLMLVNIYPDCVSCRERRALEAYSLCSVCCSLSSCCSFCWTAGQSPSPNSWQIRSVHNLLHWKSVDIVTINLLLSCLFLCLVVCSLLLSWVFGVLQSKTMIMIYLLMAGLICYCKTQISAFSHPAPKCLHPSLLSSPFTGWTGREITRWCI